MVVDEREDLTVEERLEAAEKRIAFLNREVVSLGWAEVPPCRAGVKSRLCR